MEEGVRYQEFFSNVCIVSTGVAAETVTYDFEGFAVGSRSYMVLVSSNHVTASDPLLAFVQVLIVLTGNDTPAPGTLVLCSSWRFC